jgi:hypothetical protein
MFGTYEEVRKWFHEKKITTTGQWKAWKNENDRPPHIPGYPDEVFADEFKRNGGWPGFLEIPRAPKTKGP